MNTTNENFGKLLQDGTLEYAPKAFKHGNKDYLHPTAADYKTVEFLPIIISLPSQPAPEGKHYEPDGYETIDENAIQNKWKLVDNLPAPPRVFSKMKMVAELTRRNILNQVKAWIVKNKLYDLYLAAQVFKEDNSYFKSGLKTLQNELKISNQDVEDILEASIMES